MDIGKHAAGVTCTATRWYTGIWGVSGADTRWYTGIWGASGADTDAGNPSQPSHKIKEADAKWETDAALRNR